MYSTMRVVFGAPAFFLEDLSLSSQHGLYSSSASASANSAGVAYTSAVILIVNFFGRGVASRPFPFLAFMAFTSELTRMRCSSWEIVIKMIIPATIIWASFGNYSTKLGKTSATPTRPTLKIAWRGKISLGLPKAAGLFSLIFSRYSSVISRFIDRSTPRSLVKA